MLERIAQRWYRLFPPLAARELVVIAAACGIALGFVEGTNAAIRARVHHLPTGEYTWTELLWMAPLVATGVLLLIAGSAILLDRALRTRGLLRRAAALLVVMVSTYSVLRGVWPPISSYAALIFGIGCAAAFAQISSAQISRATRAAPPPLAVAAGLLLLWGVGVPLQRRVAERELTAALPPAPPSAPNVLLVIWDTARALSLSLYGHHRETTPELESFAREGTVFERAFATTSWSLPSHASLYTGREPHEFQANRDVPLDDTYPTLAEVLARHGYVTAGITGNLYYGSRDFGLARGFAWYDNSPPLSLSKMATTWAFTRRVLSTWRRHRGNHQSIVRRPGSHVTSSLLQWIDRRGTRPFFASVNYFDAHEPYLAPAPFNLAFADSQPRYWVDGQPRDDPSLLRELEIAYESCIRYVDHEFARLLAALRQRGILDNTVVIVVSDHGEQFGQYHGTHLLGHDRSLYASVLRVPLVLWYPPRVPAGVRQRSVVSLRDIPATVLDILGLPNEAPFPGTSLLRYATGAVSGDDVRTPRLARLEANRFYTAEMDWAQRSQHRFSLAADSLHYIVDASGNESLYDFVHDPWELRDLIDEPRLSADVQRFRAHLDSVIPDSMQVLRQISAR